MRYLRPSNDMVLESVVLVNSGPSYTPDKPVKLWYDRDAVNSETPNLVYYQLVMNAVGKIVLNPIVISKDDAANSNVPPPGAEKNVNGEIMAPVSQYIDLSRITTNPLTDQATWRPNPEPVDDNDLMNKLNEIDSKLDKIINLIE